MPMLGMRRGGAPQAAPAPAAAGAAPAATGAAPAAAAPAAAQGGGDLDNRLQVRERLFAFGDDFWIENSRGQRLFLVDGKALRLRDTLLFKDQQGQERYKLQDKVARVRETMTLYDAQGGTAATIKKAMISPLRDRYTVDVPGQAGLETQGNILHHEYTVEQGGRRVASISKSWFRIRDTYGIEVVPGTIDPLLAVAMTVGIDMMQGAG